MAEAALEVYGFAEARLKFITLAGNAVYRVFASNSETDVSENDPFVKDQYLLRIHDCREQDTDAIELEMEWLTAIRRDAGLPVPEPVFTADRKLLIKVSVPGIPDKRDVTLLRWIKGRFMGNNIRPNHFKAQGRLMAQLHNHAQHWQPPPGLTKRRFNPDGLFKDDAGAGFPNSEAWALLPESYLKPFEAVARKTTQVMNELGKGSGVYGLIHGDCGVDANVLFHKGEARIIDFDGSGFGYYAYDLSLALEHCWDDKEHLRYRDALLDGYAEFRTGVERQLKHMDLFLAAFYVYMGLWTIAVEKVYPDAPGHPQRRQRWLERGLRYIESRRLY
ncbi:MAG: phosphotransferase [Candidatus Zixiibacteriota bacterium]|nr:MAG: phosphotransferase [candidate division Zixibacteria bacterium]